jgi:hypothetical protein
MPFAFISEYTNDVEYLQNRENDDAFRNLIAFL